MSGLITRRAPRVLVHVGLPKCGSTAIQAHFANHDKAHRGQGVVYPMASRAQSGYRSHRLLSHAPVNELPTRLEEIAAEAQQADTIFLSCESWTSLLPAGQARTLGTALAQVFDPQRVTIVAWFRNPIDFIEAAYAQFLVGGLMNASKPTFFARDAPAPNLTRFVEATTAVKGFAPFDYLGWIAALEAAFAGFPVLACSMAAEDLPAGGLLQDAQTVVGLRGRAQDVRRNQRRPVPTLLALQFAQTQIPAHVMLRYRPLMRRFRLSTSALWGTTETRHQDLHVGSALYERIRTQTGLDRAKIAQRFATPVQGLLRLTAPIPLSARALTGQERAEVMAYFGVQD